MKKLILLFSFTAFILHSCGTVKKTPEKVSLAGEWKLQNNNEIQTGMSGEAITIAFDLAETNRISGFGGCNNYGANYTAEAGYITLTEVFATKRACPELDAEDQYFELLNLVNRFEIQGNDLYFYQDKLLLLHFEK